MHCTGPTPYQSSQLIMQSIYCYYALHRAHAPVPPALTIESLAAPPQATLKQALAESGTALAQMETQLQPHHGLAGCGGWGGMGG